MRWLFIFAVFGVMISVFIVSHLSGQPEHTPKIVHDSGKTVLSFGAVGDNEFDNTTAIRQAIQSGIGHIHFPAGIYQISETIEIDLSKSGPVAITGNGLARIIMTGPGPALRFIGSHGGTADPKSVNPKIWTTERMPIVDGIEITGAHPEASGIEAHGTMNLIITRLFVRNCLHGIHLTKRNRNVLISNCHLYENRGVGVFLDNVNLHQMNVTGSHISYNNLGGVVVKAGEVRNLHITGCDIESNHRTNSPPTANVLIDSVGGTNAEIAITGNTIQHNHQAKGSANIRIIGPTIESKKTPERRDGHVTITGNVLSDVQVGIHLQDARGVVISGNTSWMSFEHNLLVENSSHIIVGENSFERNPRYDYGDSTQARNAIAFRSCSECTLNGFHVSEVHEEAGAVVIEECSRMNISNLTILDCDHAGLVLKNVTRSRIADCFIRDDRKEATSFSLKVTGGENNVIRSNVLGRPAELPEQWNKHNDFN
ncbi:MAG: right-handed parallel beta-helix repeat-containing protein [Zavarzinella sp.]